MKLLLISYRISIVLLLISPSEVRGIFEFPILPNGLERTYTPLEKSVQTTTVQRNTSTTGFTHVKRGIFNFPSLPSYNLNPINWILPSASTTTRQPPPRFDTPRVPTRIVTPEETVFKLGPKLQSFFDPGDPQARENFILSPLSAAMILAQILIGTHGWHNQMIKNILDLSEERPPNTEIRIIKETKDKLHDSEFHHSAFHFNLTEYVRESLSSSNQDKAVLNSALFYKKSAELVEHYRNKTNMVYRDLDYIPIDFENVSSSTDAINQWGKKKNEPNLATHLTGLIQPSNEGFLLHTLRLEFTWKTPLSKSRKKQEFEVTPYEIVEIKYLEGTIPNTKYMIFNDFTLVSIPLNHDNTNVYILLPRGSGYTDYNIRQFSERLETSRFLEEVMTTSQDSWDVKIKIPDIFSQFISFDVMKPFLMYINQMKGTSSFDTNLKLNGAASDLSINNLIQHLHLSIKNNHPKDLMRTRRSGSPPINFKGQNDLVYQHVDTNNHFHNREKRGIVDFEVTRPFVFIIMKTTTKMVLVWGSISHPEKLRS